MHDRHDPAAEKQITGSAVEVAATVYLRHIVQIGGCTHWCEQIQAESHSRHRPLQRTVHLPIGEGGGRASDPDRARVDVVVRGWRGIVCHLRRNAATEHGLGRRRDPAGMRYVGGLLVLVGILLGLNWLWMRSVLGRSPRTAVMRGQLFGCLIAVCVGFAVLIVSNGPVLETLYAIGCLTIGVVFVLGGAVDGVYQRIFARSTEAGYAFKQRNPWVTWPLRTPTYETEVRISRVVMGLGGALFTLVSVAWLIAIVWRSWRG